MQVPCPKPQARARSRSNLWLKRVSSQESIRHKAAVQADDAEMRIPAPNLAVIQELESSGKWNLTSPLKSAQVIRLTETIKPILMARIQVFPEHSREARTHLLGAVLRVIGEDEMPTPSFRPVLRRVLDCDAAERAHRDFIVR
jgi:hypothetical protein